MHINHDTMYYVLHIQNYKWIFIRSVACESETGSRTMAVCTLESGRMSQLLKSKKIEASKWKHECSPSERLEVLKLPGESTCQAALKAA